MIGLGQKIDVHFYGDNTYASVSKKCVFPITASVDVNKHKHKKGHAKAMAEAHIEIRHRERLMSSESNIRRLAICGPDVHETPKLQHSTKKNNESMIGRITRSQGRAKSDELAVVKCATGQGPSNVKSNRNAPQSNFESVCARTTRGQTKKLNEGGCVISAAVCVTVIKKQKKTQNCVRKSERLQKKMNK